MLDEIRLIDLEARPVLVQLHKVDTVSWDNVWTISHIWDRGGETTIPLEGVSWSSTSFSSTKRFDALFKVAHLIVMKHGARYVWMDAACIDQSSKDDKNKHLPFMGVIYSKSAGSVAFGTLTGDDKFAQIVTTRDNGRKAWVCDWFERVWTFQELQLPRVLLFVSGDPDDLSQVDLWSRDELYLSILTMSPYLTSPHPSPPPNCNDPTLSIQDVLNALSPMSKTNTQRSLMQTCKRGCHRDYINDKVYGILGVLASESEPFSRLKVDYEISLKRAVLNLMKLMPSNDVLDTLTFNTLPPRPTDGTHDGLHWSGMVMLDRPTEHPSYERDIHHSTNARVVVTGHPPRVYTVVYDALLFKVVVKKPKGSHAETANTDAHVQWPTMETLSKYARVTGNFSGVGRSPDYASAVGRAKRSMMANSALLLPLLERGGSAGDGGKELSSILRSLPSQNAGTGGIPPNRLGNEDLFYEEVTVLVCRSKVDKSFHYGIVVTPNEDCSWHKVCTAAFSHSCVKATRVEDLVMIGK